MECDIGGLRLPWCCTAVVHIFAVAEEGEIIYLTHRACGVKCVGLMHLAMECISQPDDSDSTMLYSAHIGPWGW